MTVKVTPHQRELIVEALELHLEKTRKLRSMAGIRGYSTKAKHQEALRDLRLLIELFQGEESAA